MMAVMVCSIKLRLLQVPVFVTSAQSTELGRLSCPFSHKGQTTQTEKNPNIWNQVEFKLIKIVQKGLEHLIG